MVQRILLKILLLDTVTNILTSTVIHCYCPAPPLGGWLLTQATDRMERSKEAEAIGSESGNGIRFVQLIELELNERTCMFRV